MKQILSFAFPLLLGNLFQQLYNIADLMIVGRTLGIEALAAVGASSSLNFMILGFCIGSCSGFTIPVAQRFGAGDHSAMRKYVFNAAILSGIIAALLTVITAVFCRQILTVIKTPDDIMQGAYDYLIIIFLGIPFTVLYNLAAGILRALGDSKSPFLILIVSTVVNILGDLFTILMCGMGVAGAALSTITAQAISGILCLVVIIKKFPVLHLLSEDRRVNKRLQSVLFTMGVPMGLQYSITAIGSVMLQTAVNSLGSVIVASFSAAIKVKQITMAPFDALASTAATFSGQNLGAGKIVRIKRGVTQMIVIGGVYALLIGSAMFLAGDKMVGIFLNADESEVIQNAYQQLRYMSVFYIFLAVLNVVRSSVQGMGYSGLALLAGVLEMIARTAMALWVIPVYGYHAVCFTDQTAWITSTIYVVIIFGIVMKKELAGHTGYITVKKTLT